MTWQRALWTELQARPAGRSLTGEFARAGPIALILAAGLGGVLVAGAHLSNAWPYAEQPFGWPGPAVFQNAVAMVRPELVLATTVPAMLMGVRAFRSREPASEGPGVFATVAVTDMVLLALAAGVAGGIGMWGSAGGPFDAWLAFSVAHALLALAFWSLAVLVSVAIPWAPVAAAGGVWIGFVALYENLVRLRLFREVGFHGLQAGQFPMWFFVAQALSPLAAYRGTLILWRPGFMDYLERSALGGAELPPWLTARNMALFMLVVWVFVPVVLAALVWWARGRWARRPSDLGATHPAAMAASD